MSDLHYNYIKSKFGDKSKVLFTDTDSLGYGIEILVVYREINQDAEKLFDTSN